MAVQQLSPALHAPAHPMAKPGFGKRSAPDQEPRRAGDFAHLPKREAAIAGYIDRLPEGADISIKALARELEGYGQCAVGTVLRRLSEAGHLRRVRRDVQDAEGARWVYRTFFTRTARPDAWWAAFLGGDVPQSGMAAPRPCGIRRRAVMTRSPGSCTSTPGSLCPRWSARRWRGWPGTGSGGARPRRSSWRPSRRCCRTPSATPSASSGTG
ncbi:hypothetical protein [Streptomyces chryseus]|uniref:Uncharacterized protein n=1 Tax=Streptomyces chryseus TaxID=68186 RepID=A0ABQ3DMG7_9ACTN|nr:hypothetical protein [Streptomyces chryseus]GHB06711.1 hypothetical protein GCM10010346_32350 [Streptomyces chryseus]